MIRKEQTTRLAILRSPNTIATTNVKCSSRLSQRCQEKLVVECEKEHVVSKERRKYETVAAMLLSQVLLTRLCPAYWLGRRSEPSIDLFNFSHTVSALNSERSAHLRGKSGNVVHFRNGIG